MAEACGNPKHTLWISLMRSHVTCFNFYSTINKEQLDNTGTVNSTRILYEPWTIEKTKKAYPVCHHNKLKEDTTQ